MQLTGRSGQGGRSSGVLTSVSRALPWPLSVREYQDLHPSGLQRNPYRRRELGRGRRNLARFERPEQSSQRLLPWVLSDFKSERTSEFEMRHSAIGYNSMCSAMIDELL